MGLNHVDGCPVAQLVLPRRHNDIARNNALSDRDPSIRAIAELHADLIGPSVCDTKNKVVASPRKNGTFRHPDNIALNRPLDQDARKQTRSQDEILVLNSRTHLQRPAIDIDLRIDRVDLAFECSPRDGIHRHVDHLTDRD